MFKILPYQLPSFNFEFAAHVDTLKIRLTSHKDQRGIRIKHMPIFTGVDHEEVGELSLIEAAQAIGDSRTSALPTVCNFNPS